jgi:hypothetical protein
MRVLFFTFWLLHFLSGDLRSTQGSQERAAPLLRGSVSDASTSRPLSGVSVQIISVENPSARLTAITNDVGRFEIRVDRRGDFRLVIRRPGYVASERTIQITSDTADVSLTLTPVAQPLPEVSVRESEIELFVRDLRRAYRSVNRARVFDARQMERTGQMLTGPFVLGQAGVVAVPCQRSAAFLPKGIVRTEPVDHEPADIWWPCFLDRGKPRSILVSIDGGAVEPLDAIRNRVLSEFAAIAVVHGGIVIAYTKDYATRRRQAKRQPHD